MFGRAISSIVTTAAACACAVLAVFFSGFAFYALLEPQIGRSGAAAIVALVAAFLLALYALAVVMRARKREAEREEEQAELQANLADDGPLGLGEFAQGRPLITLAVAAIGGLLAARHPTLVRDLVSLLTRMGRR